MKKGQRVLLVVGFFIAFGGYTIYAIGGDYQSISADKAVNVIENEKDIIILDVRTEGEYKGELGHLKGAKLIPIGELDRRIGELAGYKNKKILVYCHSGVRSRRASGILSKNGFTNVLNIASGMVGMNQSSSAQKLIER